MQVTATALVTLRDWTFLLGPGTMAGVNALLLGSVLFRARLVPRLVPAMGLLGAPLILGAAVATFFGLVEQLSVWSALATAPIAAWELSLGICLVVKGFRSTTVASTTHDPGTPVVRSDAVPVG